MRWLKMQFEQESAAPDWIFVLAGGGGGTGSACPILHNALSRHLKTVGASGKVVYIISRPSAQGIIKFNHREKL